MEAATACGSHRSGVAVVKVGDDPASAACIPGKRRACEEVGILSLGYDLPAAPEAELLALICAQSLRARARKAIPVESIDSVWPDPE